LPDVMTPKEEQCYSNRYSDLGEMTPIEHYLEEGQQQGRMTQCGTFMTWMMAARYLDRYWEIGDKFGRNGKASVQLAKEHWYKNGSMQTPKLSIAPNYPEEEPYKCGDENDACACNGRVHYGLRVRPDDGNEIETFQGLHEFKYTTKKTQGIRDPVVCRESDMSMGKHMKNQFGQFKELPK